MFDCGPIVSNIRTLSWICGERRSENVPRVIRGGSRPSRATRDDCTDVCGSLPLEYTTVFYTTVRIVPIETNKLMVHVMSLPVFIFHVFPYVRHFVELVIRCRSRRGGPPPRDRGSLYTSNSELSEGICMIPNFFSLKKVDWFAFHIFMGCWLLQTSRKYHFVAAPSLKSPCVGY